MKTLYIECQMGIAGDMLMAALYELVPDKAGFIEKINSCGIPNVSVKAIEKESYGITGTHMEVLIAGVEEGHERDHHHHHEHDHHHHHHEHHHDHGHEHEHHHSSLKDIEHIIDHLDLSQNVKDRSKEIYGLIAKAEGKVHGKPAGEVHFHEVGTFDAIADVVGNCLLMEMLGAEHVIISPIHVGSGQVKCAHGMLPVPAPATSLILQGMEIYGGEVVGELCTPTGAALGRAFADEIGTMKDFIVEKIGYGIGRKDFGRANMVRVFLGEKKEVSDGVIELISNIDDMTGEEIGFACERLLEEGALDVYTESIFMKKGRPAVKLSVLINPRDKEKFIKLIFKHTQTLGIRMVEMERAVLNRAEESIDTGLGLVEKKVSKGYGVKREKIEFETLKKIAIEKNISLREARALIEK